MCCIGTLCVNVFFLYCVKRSFQVNLLLQRLLTLKMTGISGFTETTHSSVTGGRGTTG